LKIKKGHIGLIASLAIVFIGLVQCMPKEKEPQALDRTSFAGLHDTARYVGMQTCRGCHAEIYDTYRHTGMGLSIDSASQSKSAAVLDEHSILYDSVLDLNYQPFWKGDEFFLMEFRLKGTDTIHKRIEKIDFIIGSGQHTNSHLMIENGYVHQLPFTFYTQSGILDFPPGFEDGGNTRFSRKIGLECMSCHNGLPKFVEGSENKFDAVPVGIDCERCHGPGSIHVYEKSLNIIVDTSKYTDYSIVNPAKLESELQLEVCQRCHLQGNAVLAEGKSFFDFKPGMALEQVMTVFMPVYEGAEDEFIMASHVERFKLSKCYLSDPQKFNCIDCHNPHMTVQQTDRVVFNNSCIKCHGGGEDCSEFMDIRAEKEDDCVLCHMPSSSSIDIPHVSVHDHRIAVHRDKLEEEEDKVRRFLGLRAVNGHPNDRMKAQAYLQQYEKFTAEPDFLDSASFYISNSGNDPSQLIHLWFLEERYEEIAQLARSNDLLGGLNRESLDNKDAWTCYRVGEAAFAIGDFSFALDYYQRSCDLAPYNLEFRNKLASNFLQLNMPEKAKPELEFVMQEYSGIPEVCSNLGYIYLTEGKADKALELYQLAIKLDPDYVQARINLAGYYFFLGDISGGKEELLKVLEIDPQNAQVLNALEQLKAYE
jgi:tetratricopeptide (TPR) repeat protein